MKVCTMSLFSLLWHHFLGANWFLDLGPCTYWYMLSKDKQCVPESIASNCFKWPYMKQKDPCDEHTKMSRNSYLADQLADLPPPVLASSGQEWQYDISTVRTHTGRSTGTSTPPPRVASGSQQWQFHISTVRAHIGRSTGRSTLPQYWHLVQGIIGLDIMGCIRQPLWIQEKVGICFYFLIFRVVISQHCRVLPPWHPQHPWSPPPPNDTYRLLLWELIIGRFYM